MNKKQKTMLARILAAAALLVALHFLPLTGAVRFVAYLIPYLVVGYDILLKAGKGIRNRQVFDECFLMAVATVGAIALALYEGSGEYTEAIAVMLFYQVGEWFQSYAVGKSRRNISDLMDIRPDYANVEQGGRLGSGGPRRGDHRHRPGGPAWGEGSHRQGWWWRNLHPDTAALTGRAFPGRPAWGGDHQRLHQPHWPAEGPHHQGIWGVHRVQDPGPGGERLLPEVPVGGLHHPLCPGVYPCSVYRRPGSGSLLPPLVRMGALGLAPLWGDWIYRALTFLVISCPCALVISIPLSFFAGIGGASKAGVLVKGSNYLEILSQTDYVVFDKTGTLTRGVFEVAGIHHAKWTRTGCWSTPPWRRAPPPTPSARASRRPMANPWTAAGWGRSRRSPATASWLQVDGHAVAAGNDKLMDRIGVPAEPCRQVGTVIHVAVDGTYAEPTSSSPTR